MKIYVGNLSYQSTEDEIKSFFETAGAVSSVSIIKDKFTGKSKGFAFVEMIDDSTAQKAISELNGKELGGRQLRISEARPKNAN